MLYSLIIFDNDKLTSYNFKSYEITNFCEIKLIYVLKSSKIIIYL